ncbi:hypothetical protein DY000_02048689 [Brassica cretica]|uniref:Uncharacterized protein n=1 Tax=Brassica cretica TaxID=69181 RepID=A0ABQ7EU38_BRACR|nr:hypothetical protein DY000_02048689 [Brassica cretica]
MKINQPRRDKTQELIVVALGPLANISLTVQLEPEFSKKCQTDCSSWWTIHSKRKELLQANFFSPGEHVVQQLDLMTDMLETQICGSHWKVFHVINRFYGLLQAITKLGREAIRQIFGEEIGGLHRPLELLLIS